MIALLRILPQSLHLLGFRVVLSFLFWQYPEIRSRLSKMEGKTILLEAADIHKKYPLHVRGKRIVATWRGWQSPDVVMRGDFATLWDLFRHRVDADSLFFSRRLVVEGDVQTSVFLKNLLESF